MIELIEGESGASGEVAPGPPEVGGSENPEGRIREPARERSEGKEISAFSGWGRGCPRRESGRVGE